MATICRGCAAQKKIESLPPIRTNPNPCDFCGGFDGLYDKRGNLVKKLERNYDYPDLQLPGHRLDPNKIAEQEEAGNR